MRLPLIKYSGAHSFVKTHTHTYNIDFNTGLPVVSHVTDKRALSKRAWALAYKCAQGKLVMHEM